jgi:hypothetical protein
MDVDIIGIKDWSLFLKQHIDFNPSFFIDLETKNSYSFTQSDLHIIADTIIKTKKITTDNLLFLQSRGYDFNEINIEIADIKSIHYKDFVLLLNKIPKLLSRSNFLFMKKYPLSKHSDYFIKLYICKNIELCLAND